jgi:hypothetical protein
VTKEVIELTKKSDTARLGRGVAVALMALVFALMLAVTANAAPPKERYSDDGPPEGGVITRDQPDVLGGTEPEGGALPFTGADITLFVATGLAAVGTGMFIVRRARSRENV